MEKTTLEIITARTIVANNFFSEGLTVEQKILLQGMSVALCWVCNDLNGSALQDLIERKK